MTVLSPLAANADEDDEDGDHKRGRRCDGPQEQQALVVIVVTVIHGTHFLSLTHSLPLETQALPHRLSARENLQRCKWWQQGKKKGTTYE